jgi:hypothetical protein
LTSSKGYDCYVLTSSKGYNCILSSVKIKRKMYTSSILQNFNIMHFVNFNIDINGMVFNNIYCFGSVNTLHKVLILFAYHPYQHWNSTVENKRSHKRDSILISLTYPCCLHCNGWYRAHQFYWYISIIMFVFSCSTCNTRRVALVNDPVISHDKESKEGIVTTTTKTYPWSSFANIFHNS